MTRRDGRGQFGKRVPVVVPKTFGLNVAIVAALSCCKRAGTDTLHDCTLCGEGRRRYEDEMDCFAVSKAEADPSDLFLAGFKPTL